MEDKKNQEPTEQQLLEIMDYGIKFYNVVLFLSFVTYVIYLFLTQDTSGHLLTIIAYLTMIIGVCSLRGTYKLMQKTTRYNIDKSKLESFQKSLVSTINMTRILQLVTLLVIIINIFAGSSFPHIFLLSILFISSILSMGINKTAVVYIEKLKN